MKYDYLFVGSGLFGATFAHLAQRQGKRCLVIDRRPWLGGNIYCERVEGINVHKYGAHIFHTSSKRVWDLVTSIVDFNRYVKKGERGIEILVPILVRDSDEECRRPGTAQPLQRRVHRLPEGPQ